MTTYIPQSAVVVGASNVVGMGITKTLLDAGFRVVAVQRSPAGFQHLHQSLGLKGQNENLLEVIGSFAD